MREVLQRAELVLEAQDALRPTSVRSVLSATRCAARDRGLVDDAHAACAEAAHHLEAPVGAQVELDGRHAALL